MIAPPQSAAGGESIKRGRTPPILRAHALKIAPTQGPVYGIPRSGSSGGLAPDRERGPRSFQLTLRPEINSLRP